MRGEKSKKSAFGEGVRMIIDKQRGGKYRENILLRRLEHGDIHQRPYLDLPQGPDLSREKPRLLKLQ